MKDRRIHRSNTEKMLFGVCGGLADYFDVDPTVVRVLFAVAALLNGAGIILYLALAIIMPKPPPAPTGTDAPSAAASESAPTETTPPQETPSSSPNAEESSAGAPAEEQGPEDQRTTP